MERDCDACDQRGRTCRGCINRRQRERYRSNPEPAKARARVWGAANRKECNAKSLVRLHKKIESNKSRYLFELAKRRAARHGIPFSIDPSDVVIPEKCPVLGILFNGQGSKHSRPDGVPTLDRIVPDVGYVKGNVAVISLRANRIKYNATIDELESVVRYVREALKR